MVYPDFFASCETPDDVRKTYRALAMKMHPDHGGDTAGMQELNRQYENTLKRMSGERFSTTDGKSDYTYTYNHETESAILATLSELLRMRMIGVTIELVGTWVWCSGNTKPYKDALKAMGLRWSGPRAKWYYTTQRRKRRVHYKRASFDTLRYRYGSRVVQDADA